MSAFKDMIAADLKGVFLNSEEFGELRTVSYDGERYPDIPVVLCELDLEERPQLAADHAQGLYLATAVLNCSKADLGGKVPEVGARLCISTRKGGNFFRDYYVASASDQMGMLVVELEEVSE